MKSTLPRSDVLEALHGQLLPWLRSDLIKVLLAQPPLRLPPGVVLTELPAPLLAHSHRRYSGVIQAQWPQAKVHSAPHPYLGCVLAGDANLRIGVTRRMAAADRSLARSSGVLMVSLPRFSFFVIPPGVPYSDGSRGHSEGDSGAAHSHILWLQVLPEGICAHTCRTEGEEHIHSPGVFAGNSRLRPLAEMAIAALQDGPASAPHLANSLLLSLTMWLIHDLEAAHNNAAPSITTGGFHENTKAARHRRRRLTSSALDAPVQRACDYIHNHLSHRLTVESIAEHAFISAPHLNRLFRAELGHSIMQYVTRRRIRVAQSLLRETEYSIQEISHHLGYAHPTHFSRVFARQTKTTPTTFREQPEGKD